MLSSLILCLAALHKVRIIYDKRIPPGDFFSEAEVIVAETGCTKTAIFAAKMQCSSDACHCRVLQSAESQLITQNKSPQKSDLFCVTARTSAFCKTRTMSRPEKSLPKKGNKDDRMSQKLVKPLMCWCGSNHNDCW